MFAKTDITVLAQYLLDKNVLHGGMILLLQSIIFVLTCKAFQNSEDENINMTITVISTSGGMGCVIAIGRGPICIHYTPCGLWGTRVPGYYTPCGIFVYFMWGTHIHIIPHVRYIHI